MAKATKVQCNLRLPAEVHRRLTVLARANGNSLNTEIRNRLLESLLAHDLAERLAERVESALRAAVASGQAQSRISAWDCQDGGVPPQ